MGQLGSKITTIIVAARAGRKKIGGLDGKRLLAYMIASVKIIILTKRHDMKGQPSNENSIQVPWFLVCIAHAMLKTAFLPTVTIACLYTPLLVSSILLLVRPRIVN